MPTRKQDPDKKRFSQTAFSSSAEFDFGVLGNLVSARCHQLSDPEEIAMLWWLQQVSWREGGLEKFATDLLAKNVARLGICRPDESELRDEIRRLLLDPQSPSPKKGLWNFSALWDALNEWRADEIAASHGRIVETAISRQVFEELDFTLASRSFVLLEGREGIGKTEAVRAWCALHPGRVLYVRLESSLDDGTFYRTIARKLGTAASLSRNTYEVRVRVEDALQRGHLMLVVDEAHFLWPMSERSERGAPKRVDWLRTSIVDNKVPVALISTPQFFERQCDRFKKHGWNANQVQRRLTRTARLPEVLTAEDAIAVARKFFPIASTPLAKKIAGVALISVGYLTSIEHLRKRVDFFRTRRAGCSEIALIEEAVAEMAGAQGIITQAQPASTEASTASRRASRDAAPRVEEPATARTGNVTIPQPVTACV